MREPLLVPFVALATGILVAHFFFYSLGDLIVPATLAALVLAAAFTCSHSVPLRFASACAALFVMGIGTQVIHRQRRTPRLDVDDGEVAVLAGCVVNPPVFSPYREQFTLQLAPKASARISVMLKGDQKLPLEYGRNVEIAAKVRAPRNFQNPDAFDYVGYLANQHIYWTGSVASLADVHVLNGRCGWRALGWLYAIRTWAVDRLTSLYPNDPHTSGVLKATLIGETAGVEKRWTDDFRVTGTYHAIVISGLHVAIVSMTLLFLLRILHFRRIPALGVASAVSWLYAFLSGFNPPVIRAAAGFMLFWLASYFFRKTRILNIVGAVGLVYLLLDPDALFDASFQLSFLSAAAIAAFAIPVMERFTEPLRGAVKRFDQIGYDPQVETRAAQWRTELRLFAETLRLWTGLRENWAQQIVWRGVTLSAIVLDFTIVSACIQFGLALPMINYFHRLSVTGLSANVIVVPLLALVVPLGFASIATGWHFLASLTKLLLDWADSLAAWHVRFEPAWRMTAIPLEISIAFSTSLVILAICVRHTRRWMFVALACSLGLFAVVCIQPWKPDVRPRMLEVSAIDVSQGDSLLVVFPDGQTMLVDAGGFPGAERMVRKPQIDMGEDVVSPYLWGRKIRRLDYAVLTHGHSDHMGGLGAILDNFRPRVLWIGAEPETPEWKKIEHTAAADGVRIVALNRASRLTDIGGTHIRVLAPSVDYVPGENAGNNDSLVMEVKYGRRSVLLTGDAERPVEDDMVNSGELEPVTLLKVGHHGSRTSSSEEFLDQVNPRFAFISDGYKNQFHHPHPDVLARLTEHHATVFRTDQQGLVTFRTDGDKVEVETFR